MSNKTIAIGRINPLTGELEFQGSNNAWIPSGLDQKLNRNGDKMDSETPPEVEIQKTTPIPGQRPIPTPEPGEPVPTQRPIPTPEPGEPKPEKEPGMLGKFAAYIKKNQASEEARRKRTGEASFTEELSAFGSEWSKNLTKGMASVGNEEERKISGKSGNVKIVQDDDNFADDILFGTKRNKKQSTPSTGAVDRTYTDKEFIERLCAFMRYVAEDDDVGMYQDRGKQLIPVDHNYLSKLLTRYLGYKVILKERDLSFK